MLNLFSNWTSELHRRGLANRLVKQKKVNLYLAMSIHRFENKTKDCSLKFKGMIICIDLDDLTSFIMNYIDYTVYLIFQKKINSLYLNYIN